MSFDLSVNSKKSEQYIQSCLIITLYEKKVLLSQVFTNNESDLG